MKVATSVIASVETAAADEATTSGARTARARREPRSSERARDDEEREEGRARGREATGPASWIDARIWARGVTRAWSAERGVEDARRKSAARGALVTDADATRRSADMRVVCHARGGVYRDVTCPANVVVKRRKEDDS
jgi:hypothetical protein